MPDIIPTVKFQLNRADLRRFSAALSTLPEGVRKSVAANALKTWAGPVVARAKAGVPVRTGRLRRSIASKVKRYRRGVWVVVGAKLLKFTEARAKRKEKLGNDYLGAGWRVHFAERGFHPRGGKTFVAGHNMLRDSIQTHSSQLLRVVEASVAEAIKKAGLS